jgi:hypothetical protein
MFEEPMNNATKLKEAMEPGRVYRRQDLEELSTAVDRELKTLVDSNEVRKLSGGLYCRPKPSQWGALPPDDRELVRAFLKTDDYRLTSYNDFNVLGLGLTQVYTVYVVYNHKRAGTFTLGGKEFRFRLVPAYPTGAVVEPEYLLVDMLNNLRRLPDNVELVLRNLKKGVQSFDRAKVLDCLERYGNPAAKRLLREAYA